MEFWRQSYDCRTQSRHALAHREPLDPTRVSVIDWTDCRDGSRLRLYRVDGGGHQAPSFQAAPEETRRRFGRRNGDFDAAEAVWDFFKGVRR